MPPKIKNNELQEEVIIKLNTIIENQNKIILNLTNINLENNNIITNLNLTISNNLIEIKNQIQLNQISMQDTIKTLEEKTNNNISKYSDIVKSNLPSSSSTATPPNPPTPTYSCSSKTSIVIEHVLLADRNLTYIKSLFVHLRSQHYYGLLFYISLC